MRLCVDAGNTNVTFALFDQEYVNEWRIDTREIIKNGLLAEYLLPMAQYKIDFCLVSSVVPQISQGLCVSLAKYLGIRVRLLEQSMYDALPIRLHNPKELGTDLLANAMAAWQLCGGANMVIDFGTALSMTMTNAQGVLCGVALLPGLLTAFRSLFEHTAQLPQVTLKMPSSMQGQDTEQAIQAGIVLGYKYLIDGMIRQARAELGADLKVYATGGLGHILSEHIEGLDGFYPHLTVEGLYWIGLHVQD